MITKTILEKAIEMLEHNEPITPEMIIAFKIYNKVIPMENCYCIEKTPTYKAKFASRLLDLIPIDTPIRVIELQKQYNDKYYKRTEWDDGYSHQKIKAYVRKLQAAGLVKKVIIGYETVSFERYGKTETHKQEIVGFRRVN